MNKTAMSAPPSSRSAIARHSLHDAITSHLRDMIIEGELEPGKRIYEGPLCERLGVSRTPLREALRFLASEGLVDLTPQRGASVRQFSAKDIQDMLVLIRTLEELAGRLACEQGSDEEISEVRRLHDEMLDYYRDGNRLDYYKTNQRIHSAIVALSHNESLIQVHASLQSKLKRVRFIGHEGKEKWAAAVAEHESMIQALERRDTSALVGALSAHLEHAWERVRDVV
ncbi:GntR family transcriptional regulator [Salinicola halophyticus]|uniref:GntR family transcriptional regulator n=1 Tax=Salinicola halophyticus TaxID=1808881 RepID=UPI000DA13605|nr:GntR family transcriptional regulator [Salinicola halophyticus]